MPSLPRAFNVADHYLLPNLTPDRASRPYMLCGEDTLTYGELHRRAHRMARALVRLGVEPENRVMLLLRDTLAFPVCFWGTIRRGAVAVPVNTLLSTEDYLFMLEDSRARVLVVDHDLWPKIEPLRDRLTWVERVVIANGEVPGLPTLDELLDGESDEFETVLLTPDDPAFWLYTSGSTGRPKAAVHLHRNMPAVTAGLPTLLDLVADDVHFSAAKLFFAYGLGNGLYFPMPDGARSVLLPDWPTPERVFATLERFRPTVFYAVPTLFNGLLHAVEDWESGRAEPPEGLSSPPRLDHLRFCISAGEALPAPLYHRWRERFGCEVLDGIGSTENLHDFIVNRPGRARPGSSGQVMPGYEAKIVDERGVEVEDGQVGALWIRGDSAAARYWNRRDKTRASMRGEWLVTGDQYHRDEDGYYWHHGRNDDMMKVSGSWVSPVEVESALGSHPAVAECAVVGRRDDEGLTKPHAFVVPRAGYGPGDGGSGDDDLADALRAHVREHLAGFKVPRWVDFVTELPKTATGKIRRFELRSD
jgi:4-hydroxybenzoate-CoA ligase